MADKIYLFDHSPHLRGEWDYEKNTILSPNTVTYASQKAVWWVCIKGHSYDMKVCNKVIQSLGCPVCSNRRILPGYNDLLTTHPHLASELVDKSLRTQIGAGSNRKLLWTCTIGHRWEAMANSRTRRGDGCPYCARKRMLSGFNDLATLSAELILHMVDPSLASTLSPHDKRKVMWKCSNGHHYSCSVANKQKDRGCPICSGRKLSVGVNDLRTTHPELSMELYDVEDATRYTANSTKKAAWICKSGHQYHAQIQRRRREGYGCPYCSSTKLLIGYNDIATTEPDLSSELLDQRLSTKIMRSSGKKVDWICKLGHVWTVSPNNRTNKSTPSGCPSCSMNQKSKVEDELKGHLAKHFTSVTPVAKKARVPVQGYTMVSRSVDMVIVEATKQIVVEYDGAYWHWQKHQFDAEKTLNLLENGYLVVRVREQGRMYKLDKLDLDHTDLLQINMDYPYSDTHIRDITLYIKQWIIEKTTNDKLL